MSAGLEPRLAEAEDAAPMAAVRSDWALQTPWMPKLHSRESHLAHMRRQMAQAQVWTIGTPALGCLVLDGDEVDALYLAPQARGRGLGKALLDKTKSRQSRLELWVFQANEGARRFYQREGFVELRRTEGEANEEGLPDIRMGWRRA